MAPPAVRVRGDSNAQPGICAECGRRLSDHALGEWCRPGMTRDELRLFDRRDIRTKRFTADVTPPKKEKRMPKKTRKRVDHSAWLQPVMVDLGASEEQVCDHCGGTGRSARQWTVGEFLGFALPHRPRMTAAGSLAGILENPRLDDLQAIAKLLDGQLEDAADWSREVAQKIREALAE